MKSRWYSPRGKVEEEKKGRNTGMYILRVCEIETASGRYGGLSGVFSLVTHPA